MQRVPLLSGSDRAVWPKAKGRSNRCPVCRGRFKNGSAYLCGGSLLLDKTGRNSINTTKLKAFLDIGFHGADPDMRDTENITLVHDLDYGQFDLYWCSIKCMRAWLLKVLDRIEKKVKQGSKAIARERSKRSRRVAGAGGSAKASAGRAQAERMRKS